MLARSLLAVEQLPMAAIAAIGFAVARITTCDGTTNRAQRFAVKMTLPITVSGSPCTLAEMLSSQRPAMVRSVLNA